MLKRATLTSNFISTKKCSVLWRFLCKDPLTFVFGLAHFHQTAGWLCGRLTWARPVLPFQQNWLMLGWLCATNFSLTSVHWTSFLLSCLQQNMSRLSLTRLDVGKLAFQYWNKFTEVLFTHDTRTSQSCLSASQRKLCLMCGQFVLGIDIFFLEFVTCKVIALYCNRMA